MQIHPTFNSVQLPGSWLTIGSFDGVHLGHQKIIASLVSGARQNGVPAVVLTFEPHPAAVLRPERPPRLLTPVGEKAELLRAMGVDLLIVQPFDQAFSRLTAQDFLAGLQGNLGFRRLLVGYDFAMGRDRSGDIPSLLNLQARYGFALEVVDPVVHAGEVVSSSRVRRALSCGEVDLAAALLGRPYTLSGEVVPGAQRGRSIGIPTANIAVNARRAVPQTGVYACRATVDGLEYGAAANIGVRPTFEADDAEETVEAHLLDFDREIYGKTVQISFLARLRGERKFPGVEALVAQIRDDIRQAREVLNAHVP